MKKKKVDYPKYGSLVYYNLRSDSIVVIESDFGTLTGWLMAADSNKEWHFVGMI